MVRLVLNDFTSVAQMDLSGAFITEVLDLSYDVVANFYCTVADMSNVFQFQTDSRVVGGVSDPSMVFFVHLFDSSAGHFDASTTPSSLFVGADCHWPMDGSGPSAVPLLSNPGNAVVTDVVAYDAETKIKSASPAYAGWSSDPMGAYSMHDMGVISEYQRYLACKLFNTAYGTEMFTNTLQMNADLNKKLGTYVSSYAQSSGNVVLKQLLKVATTANSLSIDKLVQYQWEPTGDIYLGLPSSYTSNDNLTRELMEQMEASAPERFNNIQGNTAPQGLPFKPLDTIEYQVTIKAANGQNDLTGVGAINDRVYKIVLNIMADGTTVNSSESSGVAVTSPVTPINVIMNTVPPV